MHNLILALVILAFADGVVAAQTKQPTIKSKGKATMIELKGLAPSGKLILPTPKHHTNAVYNLPNGKSVERKLRSHKNFNRLDILDFAELPGGWKKNGPFGGKLEVRVNALKGIKTVDDVVTHFLLLEGPIEDLKKRTNETYSGVSIQEVKIGSIVTIDLGQLGWTPGNTYVYALIKNKDKVVTTLHFSPTYFLDFAWDQAKWIP